MEKEKYQKEEDLEESKTTEENIIPHSNSPFKQQKVSACKPFLTPFFAGLIYLVLAIISLVIGILYQMSSSDLFELVLDYTDLPLGGTGKINFTIEKEINGNLYLYYEIDKLYQNQFEYISSKSMKQLKGEKRSEIDISACEPREKQGNLPYAPCGSIASSVFNDSFAFEESISIDETGLSLDYYQKHFKPLNPEEWNSTSAILVLDETLFPGNVTNEHFQAWMQPSPIGRVRKPWGKILTPLSAGTYHILIENNYPVVSFDGRKKVIISEVSWFGTKNGFFGIFFLVVGGLSILTSVIFFILYFLNVFPLYKHINEEVAEEELI